MKCGTSSSQGWVYPLSPPYRMKFTDLRGKQFTWHFESFIISKEKTCINSRSSTLSRWHPYVKDNHFTPHIVEQDQLYGSTAEWDSNFILPFKRVLQEFNDQYRSRFQLCKGSSPCKTPEQVCYHFGSQGDVFAKLKSNDMHPDYFPASSDQALPRRDNQINWSDARVEQEILKQILPCSLLELWQPPLINKCYDNWFCQVFPFRNECGKITMQLIKLYDPEKQMKCLIPVTTWMRANCPYNQYFCVPLPEDKQPLYNLDLLLKQETGAIILTDSVEIADSNQRKASDGIVFTSFICSPDRYEQVDWSPLRKKKVYYLITNHSGICFEDAVLKAREFKETLERKEPEIEIAFITLPVDYQNNKYSSGFCRDFKTVDDIRHGYQEQPPIVRQKGFKILESNEAFQKFCSDAEKARDVHPREWYDEESPNDEQVPTVDQENKNPKPIDYVMRPFLIRGEATMLYARKSVGKSSLAYSIAARVVAADFSNRPVPLLPEKWWTVPQKGHKVLYLDFENQQQVERKRELFQNPYFPRDKYAECKANLLIKDMSLSGKDYSSPANHQEILDMIEAAKNEGTSERPVDLLVIDTYTAFVHTETPSTPDGFKMLINKIRDKGIAILIVHHANSENEVRGLQSKLDTLAFKFKIYRNDEAPGDLEEQACWVQYEEIRGEMGRDLREPFQIKYSNDDHRWHVVDPKREQDAELKLIIKDYRRYGYSMKVIHKMIGLHKSAISDRLSKTEK